jgi:hypothetical protein
MVRSDEAHENPLGSKIFGIHVWQIGELSLSDCLSFNPNKRGEETIADENQNMDGYSFARDGHSPKIHCELVRVELCSFIDAVKEEFNFVGYSITF